MRFLAIIAFRSGKDKFWRFAEEFVDCVDTGNGHPYSCRVEVALRSMLF